VTAYQNRWLLLQHQPPYHAVPDEGCWAHDVLLLLLLLLICLQPLHLHAGSVGASSAAAAAGYSAAPAFYTAAAAAAVALLQLSQPLPAQRAQAAAAAAAVWMLPHWWLLLPYWLPFGLQPTLPAAAETAHLQHITEQWQQQTQQHIAEYVSSTQR
jgi:hypothetical protein